MINKSVLVLLLFCGLAQAEPLVPVTLKSGSNLMDLNKDGRDDNVLLANYDNNTSHPHRGILFFITQPDESHSIVPAAGSDNFIWFDYTLSASSKLIVGNRLYHTSSGYYLVNAQKQGEDVNDEQPVSFTVYTIAECPDDPGVPLYSWQPVSRFNSEKVYDSVDLAFEDVNLKKLSI